MRKQSVRRTVAELAEHVGGRVIGDGSVMVERVASIESAGAGAIAFVEDAKLLENAQNSRASCLIVPPGAHANAESLIETARPKLAFARIAELTVVQPF